MLRVVCQAAVDIPWKSSRGSHLRTADPLPPLYSGQTPSPSPYTALTAVNDVTREVGGALGGAVAASVLLAIYADELLVGLTGSRVPPPAIGTAEDGVAQALAISRELGPGGAELATVALDAFASGYGAALWVAAATLLVGAMVALVGARRDIGNRAASSGAEPVLAGQS